MLERVWTCTMGYVALTMHLHGSNDSAGYKSRLEQHPATQQNIKFRITMTVKAV